MTRHAVAKILATAVLAAITASSAQAETVSAPSRWIGRVDLPFGRFSWPGSGFEIAFTGTRLEATLSDSGKNSLIVETDGVPRRVDLTMGVQTVVLADKLKPGPHSVKVFKKTEGNVGVLRFVGATADGAVTPVTPPTRQLLVIGDSISTGYGIEGADQSCRGSTDNENQYLTFGAVAGRRFGADVTTLAVTGRGLSRNYDGSSKDTIPKVMDRAISTEAMTAGRAVAPEHYDAIVINLGTADYDGGNRPSDFVKEYQALLVKLRNAYPDAYIYASIGPLLPEDARRAAASDIDAALTARKAAGDNKLSFIYFDAIPNGFGCDWHPNAKAQAAMADQLSIYLQRDLKWLAP